MKLAVATAVIILGGGAGGFTIANAASRADDAGMNIPGQGQPGGPDDVGDGDGQRHEFGGPTGVPPGDVPGQDDTGSGEDDT